MPFYGGTYFPPEPAHGMPSFRQVMEAVSQAFGERREEIRSSASRTRAQLGAIGRIEPTEDPLEPAILEDAVAGLRAQRRHASTAASAGRPSSRRPRSLELLLARGANEVVEKTLDAMAAGGIYDQLGGGFSRYSVDAGWLVPHFEKMLYDNALLARCYLHGWQVLGHERYRRVCTETLDWALREMRGPEGGFFSALDADSEGEEGRFYVWSRSEIEELLGERAAEVISHLGVTERGNFEGAQRPPPPRRRRPRSRRRGSRRTAPCSTRLAAERVWPGLDDKRLTAWNALMIAALAEAGAVLGRGDYLEAAARCADFVLTELRDAEGGLLRTYRDGEAKLTAYLEDHAFLLEALLALYEATFEQRWFEEARALADTMISRFSDPERGGFFTTAAGDGAADRPPQGRRRPPDPLRQLIRRARACCGSRR